MLLIKLIPCLETVFYLLFFRFNIEKIVCFNPLYSICLFVYFKNLKFIFSIFPCGFFYIYYYLNIHSNVEYFLFRRNNFKIKNETNQQNKNFDSKNKEIIFDNLKSWFLYNQKNHI